MDEFQVVCSLVRMSAFGTEEDIPTRADWVKVIISAGRNEVGGLCFEAVKMLPEGNRPAPALMTRWERFSQTGREDFRNRKEALGELRDKLESRGIAMLMLGDDALADYYPDPELREGDKVRFVARTDFEGCNALVKDLGVEVNVKDEYASFYFKGVYFENFRQIPYGILMRDTVWRRDGCLDPDPVTQAVLVVESAARCAGGFFRKVPLKSLLDLAILLRRYPAVLDEWKPALRKARLRHFAKIMLRDCDTLLGTGFRKD